jgi:hypothetical protein
MTPSIFLSASLRCEHSTWSGPHATSSRVAGCTRRRTSCARRPRASPPCCCCYSAGEPCAAKSAEHRRARAAADRLLALVQTDCSGPLGLSSSTRQQAGRPSSAEVPPAVLQLYVSTVHHRRRSRSNLESSRRPIDRIDPCRGRRHSAWPGVVVCVGARAAGAMRGGCSVGCSPHDARRGQARQG